MTRSEHDLRNALHSLEHRADQHEPPSLSSVLAAAHGQPTRSSRLRRWTPPVAAAASVAAVAAVVAVALNNGSSGSGATHAPTHVPQAGGQPSGAVVTSRLAVPSTHVSTRPSTHRAARSAKAAPSDDATAILAAAADKLADEPFTTPAADRFFYVRTNQATTWTSVSGAKQGKGVTSGGEPVWISGCADGKIVSTGESGSCTLADVPRFLADAPTTPSDWDAYLEQMAPGAKAADAQGKIIVQVLHGDLVAPKAAAALLRYTETCPGLRTVDVDPVAGRQYDGVTCTSMANGSYGLVFDRTTHAFRGFVPVSTSGEQDYPAEIVLQTGIVDSVDDTP